NSGLPTDRFQVEWWINSKHLKKFHQNMSESEIIPWEMTRCDFPQLGHFDHLQGEPTIKVPVPGNFQEIKNSDLKLAVDWRMKTRVLFQTLFQKGYTAVALEKGKDDSIYYYVLVKRSSLLIEGYQQ